MSNNLSKFIGFSLCLSLVLPVATMAQTATSSDSSVASSSATNTTATTTTTSNTSSGAASGTTTSTASSTGGSVNPSTTGYYSPSSAPAPSSNLNSTNQSNSYNSNSTAYLYNHDGTDDSGSTTAQHIQNYRHQSQATQQKINALPGIADQVVTMPVLFGVKVSDLSPNFGDPRPNNRTHEGEDIMATKDTPIVSPTAAVVLSIGTGASAGNYVYTADPGGETFVYMHLDKFAEGLAVGQALNAGSLIGYVGNTGDAAGGPAHLHFEIHNSSGSPTDPFPRLTGDLSLQQKITDLISILAQSADSAGLSDFLVMNFRSTFVAAQTSGIVLPAQIISSLSTVPVTADVKISSSGSTLATGDLTSGSNGVAVVALQTYLINAATGPAAARLAIATATGSFGPLTQAALIEFQLAHGISPASGYYGSITRAYVTTHTVSGGIINTGTTITLPSSITTAPTSTVQVSGGTYSPTNTSAPVTTTIPSSVATSTASVSTNGNISAVSLTRNLYQGLSGEDVRSLQKFLNSNGFTVAVSGAGSVGNETTYFGPATTAAVIKFQIARSITPAAGYVGSITRAKLSAL